ncbi:hypothetical protein [Pleionea sp. CnH1-48]|uniref:hypothetical protein n=1 Tax=Pleionea sp. CnH1-48 TaxID=2954494 RepID=UPI002097E96E|nr:hypothetical protein [Pleionea sp. CnH1-48]MCO7225586.1 hypothetical protein [Pleionea sp. CnH1-48]
MNISMKKAIVTFSALVMSASSMAAELMSVNEFVSKTYIQGLPYEEALQYNEVHVPQLKAILNDYSQSELWPNTIVMLEIIGDKEDLGDIIRFIERDPGDEYSIAHERAKNAAIYGLGYFINHTKSKKALRYLVASLDEETWTKRNVRGLGKLHKTEGERNADFSKYAMLGLALSGEYEAISELKRFKSRKTLKMQKAGKAKSQQTRFERIAETALDEGGKINKKGLKAYYKQQHQHEHDGHDHH